MQGRLVPQTDLAGRDTGRKVCVSCHLLNHWHPAGGPCDIDGCECTYGSPNVTVA